MGLADLRTLACNQYYKEGVDLDTTDKYLGNELEAWVRALPCGGTDPTAFTITAGAITANAETADLTLTGTVDERIFRGDVLWFATSQRLIVVSNTTLLTAGAATAVPIFPAEGDVAAAETAMSYLMRPILSFDTGFLPNSTGTEATSRNRGQSLYEAKAIVSRGYNVNGSGTAVRNDAGLIELETNRRGKGILYWESRHRPFDNYGIGINANSGKAFISSHSPGADASDFIKIAYDMMGTGSDDDYRPLGMTLADAALLAPTDLYIEALAAAA